MKAPGGIAIAAIAAIAACSTPPPAGAPDARADAALRLPDARDAGDPCAGPIALGDLGGCLARAWCARAETCGFGRAGDTDCAHVALGVIGDLDTRDLGDGVAYSIAAGRAGYDPGAAASCVTAIGATSCKQFTAGTVSIDGCAALVGALGGGPPCAYPFECATGYACVYENGNFYTSTCGLDICKPTASIGADCTQLPCARGDHCQYLSTGSTCQSGDAGAMCNYDTDCDPELWCDYTGTSHSDGMGACTTGGIAGAACIEDRQCAGTLVCVGEGAGAGVCTDVSIAGAPCDGACTGALVCAAGACADAPAQGAPCAAGGTCGAFMRCDGGTCVMLGHAGDACAPGQCDLELVCTADVAGTASGACVAPLPNETGCVIGAQCATGACVNHLCSAPIPCEPPQL